MYFFFLPVIHNIRFKDFHVDWNATNEIYKYNESRSSKMIRNVRQTLGWQKCVCVFTFVFLYLFVFLKHNYLHVFITKYGT